MGDSFNIVHGKRKIVKSYYYSGPYHTHEEALENWVRITGEYPKFNGHIPKDEEELWDEGDN